MDCRGANSRTVSLIHPAAGRIATPIIYRPRDIGLEFFSLDLGPKNRLRTIHEGGLSAGIYGMCFTVGGVEDQHS